MDPQISSGLIGAAATLGAALIAKVPLERGLSVLARRRNNIPEIMNTRWRAEWRYDDNQLFVEDEVTFSKWRKKCRFEGYGEVTHGDKQYKYTIEGEISPSRVVVISYKAERYPTEASIGTACLELGDSAIDMNGYWSGRASALQNGKKIYTVRGGTVQLRKIKDL